MEGAVTGEKDRKLEGLGEEGERGVGALWMTEMSEGERRGECESFIL